MMNDKRHFKYTDKNGVKQTDIEVHVDDPEYYAKLVKAKDAFYDAEKIRERKWRNTQLTESDWMLLPDATFKGEPVTGSVYEEEILEYRKALRDYNLTTDERPESPDWY